MTASATLSGRYFDGRTAAARAAGVTLSREAAIIEMEGERIEWPARRLYLVARDETEIRLSAKKADDARLVLSADSASAIEFVYPELLSGRREKRRMSALVASLVALTAAIGAGIFWGVPAIAEPLARATPKEFEARFGENLIGQMDFLMGACGNEGATRDILAPTIERLAAAGDVGFPIAFHLSDSSVPNAFAFPGGHVMATEGLFASLSDDQEAFVAVLAHELGHVRARDSMQAVIRNAGIGLALEVITGGSGLAQQTVLLAGQLEQLRHTRRQEARADESAAEMLTAIGLDPSALGRALEKITAHAHEKEEGEAPEDRKRNRFGAWFSTHPATEARIDAALARKQPRGALPISEEDWARLTKGCADDGKPSLLEKIGRR